MIIINNKRIMLCGGALPPCTTPAGRPLAGGESRALRHSVATSGQLQILMWALVCGTLGTETNGTPPYVYYIFYN